MFTDLYFTLTQNGMTALILASNGGHAEAVTLLLDAKADANCATNVRLRVFCWVLISGSFDMFLNNMYIHDLLHQHQFI
jgi:ankyrin repeat protein